jgi:hypothetical protein
MGPKSRTPNTSQNRVHQSSDPLLGSGLGEGPLNRQLSRRGLLLAAGAASLALTACGTAEAAEITASDSASASPTGSGEPSLDPSAMPSGQPSGQPPGGGGSSPQYTPTGAYTLSEGTATKSGTITATEDNQSGVLVTGGTLTLDNAQITTSGNSSSADESSFYGLNAGVLANNGGTIKMKRGSVTTTGSGANGVFAYGAGVINLDGTRIKATGEYAHGIMASGGGVITASNLNISTAGGSSAPIATDRGSGTITVTGGSFTSSGNNSPGLYSTGKLTATRARFLSTGSEVAVIEGANSITLEECQLTAQKSGKWGVMIYQSMSGDAEGTQGVFTQTGGTLTATTKDSPLFFVTNSTGVINLNRVRLSAASGILLKAAAAQWGTTGSNGGNAQVTATNQALSGDIVADSVSTVELSLKGLTALAGAIDADNTAKSVALTLESPATWTVTANSHLTALTGANIQGNAITNISGNGNTVIYDASNSANAYLGGKTYTLAHGGTLVAA